jgi:hypothetical protein
MQEKINTEKAIETIRKIEKDALELLKASERCAKEFEGLLAAIASFQKKYSAAFRVILLGERVVDPAGWKVHKTCASNKTIIFELSCKEAADLAYELLYSAEEFMLSGVGCGRIMSTSIEKGGIVFAEFQLQ